MARIGIKALALFSSAALAMIVVVGCNPEEPAPSSTPTPAVKSSPGPTPGQAPTPSATPTTKDEVKK